MESIPRGVLGAVTLSLVAACSPPQRLEHLLNREVRWNPVPGATMVVQTADGDVHGFAAGKRGPDDRSPVQEGDVFVIGSSTKMVTAQLALQLVDEGRIELDETVDRWFPEAPSAQEVTVRHLLRHQSGYADYLELGAVTAQLHKVWAPQELLELATAAPRLGLPADGVAYYSNTNYLMLALIVEAELGVSWSEAVHARIAEPLGLETLAYAGDLGDAATVVVGLHDDLDAHKYSVDASLGFGAGGLVASAEDVLEVLRAVRSGALLSADLQAEVMEGVDFEIAGFGGIYGLGVMCVDMPEDLGGMRVCGHQGGIPGFTSSPFWDDGSDAMAVVLANGSQGEHVDAAGVAIRALAIAADVQP